MKNCTRCEGPMDENVNGKFCPRGCDCIPEPIGVQLVSKTVQVFDSTAITKPTSSSSACCGSPELAPFELHDGKAGQHCWTCGKVFQ